MPSAVIFDYGCVLSLPLDAGSIARMSALAGIPVDRFVESYLAPRRRYDLGEIDRRAYWREVLRPYGKVPDDELIDRLFLEDVGGWTQVREPMVAWARRLSSYGVKTAVLSNMPADHIEHIGARFEWLALFDARVFSAAIRLAKPDPAIYHHCLAQLGLQAADCLFIDDLAPNVEAARSVGLRAILFRSERELAEEVASLGGVPGFPDDEGGRSGGAGKGGPG